MRNYSRVAGLLLALTLTLTVALPSLAQVEAERPDYQRNNNPQNIYENWAAWTNYYNEVTAEYSEGQVLSYSADLIGEAFSATVAFQHDMWIAGDMKGCAGEFAQSAFVDATQWAVFFGAWYFNLTTEIGTIIVTEDIGARYWDPMATLITEKCWERLDT